MTQRLDPSTKIETPPEALIYAKILKYGTLIGISVMVLTFLTYILGILRPYVSFKKLPQLWRLTAHEFLEHINLKSGWDWLNYLNYGDLLNYLGIIFLSALTIIGYVAIIPLLFSSRAKTVGIIGVLEVLILILAASGILQAGH